MSRGSHPPRAKTGWAIMDTLKRCRYVPRLWVTEIEAQFALEELLAPYPKDNPWRARLKVHFVVKKGRPPKTPIVEDG